MDSSLSVCLVCGYGEALRSTILPLARYLQESTDWKPNVVFEGNAQDFQEAGRTVGELPDTAIALRRFPVGRQRSSGETMAHHAAASAPPAPAAMPLTRAPRPRGGSSSAAHPLPTGPAARSMCRDDTAIAVDGGGMPRRGLRVARELWLLRREIRGRMAELATIRPQAVVVLDDRTRNGCCWVRAAERLDLPVIALQWAATHRAETMARIRAARGGDGTHRIGTDRWERFVASRVAGSVRHIGGRAAWWISPERALAAHWLGAFPRENPWVYGGGNATRVALMGEAWRRRSLESGVSAERLVVTGHPQQDEWFQWATCRSAARQNVFRRLCLDESAAMVLLAAPSIRMRRPGGSRAGDCTPDEIRLDLCRTVKAVRESGPLRRVVVKVHPRDDFADLAFLLRGAPDDPLIVSDPTLDELTAASDVLLCQWSTSALAGAAIGVPVVVFNFRDCPSAELWRSAEGLLQADSPVRLGEQLNACLSRNAIKQKILSDQQRFAQEYLCLDGRATERVARLIDACAKNRGRGEHSSPHAPREEGPSRGAR